MKPSPVSTPYPNWLGTVRPRVGHRASSEREVAGAVPAARASRTGEQLALSAAAGPPVRAAYVALAGPAGTVLPLLPPGTYRLYGVVLGGPSQSTWRVEAAGTPVFAAPGSGSLVPAPAWVPVAGPVVARKLEGGGGATTHCTVLYQEVE